MADVQAGIAIPILGDMGIEILSMSDHDLRAKLPAKPNRNHLNTIYAGSLFSLAEFPAGALFLRRFKGRPLVPVVAEMNIRYRRPATTDVTVDFHIDEDDYVRMEKEALAEGKSSVELKHDLVDEQGTVVAIAEARYVLLHVNQDAT